MHLQPAALVGTWVCSGTAVGFQDTCRTLTLNSNGTFRDTYQSGLFYPDDMREQWNQCRIGTAPPDIAGHWTIVSISDERLELCFRADVMPFRFLCGPAPHDIWAEIVGFEERPITTSGRMVIPAGEVEVWEGGSSFANSYFYPFTETCVKQ